MKNKIKNILLPTDFSINAQRAIEFAILLFKNHSCKFHLLNVYGLPKSTSSLNFSVKGILEEQSLMNLNNEVESIELDLTDQHVELELHSIYGKVPRVIDRIVEEKKIDLIIMGSKGTSNISDSYLGSNTQYVLQKTNCPTLVIPETPIFLPSTIGFATNSQTKSNPSVFNIFKNINATQVELIAEPSFLNSSVKVDKSNCYVYDFSNNNIQLKSFTKDNVLKKINDFVKSKGIDLLALAGKKYVFFEHFINSQRVLGKNSQKLQIPTLLFKFEGL